MDDYTVHLWLMLGLSLMLAEIVVPGLVVIFLGMAALLVAGGIWLGLFSGWIEIMTAWFVASLVLVFTLRNVFARFLPGDTEVGNMDEDLDARGRLVEVVRAVHPEHEQGRILFRGTTWAARCPHAILPEGSEARLVRRELNLWIVEPANLNGRKLPPLHEAPFPRKDS